MDYLYYIDNKLIITNKFLYNDNSVVFKINKQNNRVLLDIIWCPGPLYFSLPGIFEKAQSKFFKDIHVEVSNSVETIKNIRGPLVKIQKIINDELLAIKKNAE